LATYQFADVVRTLRLVLRSTYAGLYYNQQAQRLYSQELQRLLQLVQATRLAEQQGIVSAYDVTRLEAEAQDFAGSIAALGATMAAQAADLKLLLADASPSYLLLTQEPPQRQVVVGPAWRDSVLLLRPDYLYAKAGIRRAGLNLTYQRAQATPNLVAGYNYESLGNAYTNYHGLSVGLELPFFSRNQGQIKAARIGQQAAENALAQAQAVVYTDVETARRSLVAYQTQAQAIPPGYSGRIGRLSQQADQAYRSRTIGLLDYLDKFRTYKTGSANNLELQKNLFIATETLATALGTP
jgi:cobalt-zinc-cadmium efflux system outer membrane protein